MLPRPALQILRFSYVEWSLKDSGRFDNPRNVLPEPFVGGKRVK